MCITFAPPQVSDEDRNEKGTPVKNRDCTRSCKHRKDIQHQRHCCFNGKAEYPGCESEDLPEALAHEYIVREKTISRHG